jgi:hypothetical protein
MLTSRASQVLLARRWWCSQGVVGGRARSCRRRGASVGIHRFMGQAMADQHDWQRRGGSRDGDRCAQRPAVQLDDELVVASVLPDVWLKPDVTYALQ